jgi:hypothetical protein
MSLACCSIAGTLSYLTLNTSRCVVCFSSGSRVSCCLRDCKYRDDLAHQLSTMHQRDSSACCMNVINFVYVLARLRFLRGAIVSGVSIFDGRMCTDMCYRHIPLTQDPRLQYGWKQRSCTHTTYCGFVASSSRIAVWDLSGPVSMHETRPVGMPQTATELQA